MTYHKGIRARRLWKLEPGKTRGMDGGKDFRKDKEALGMDALFPLKGTSWQTS